MQPTELPAYVAAVVVAVDLLMAALVYRAVTRLAARPGVLLSAAAAATPTGRARLAGLRRRTAWLVAAWAGLAVLVTVAPAAPPSLAVIAYVVLVTAAGYALATRTATGRALLAAVPQTWLIGAQVYRVVGAVFLVAAAVGVVPAYFARPAGWGDIATGVGAVAVAIAWARGWSLARPAAWVWNGFGLLDLVVAVGIGSSLFAAPAAALFGGSPFWLERAAAGFQPLAGSIFPVVFPLALIPTFVVPLGALLHLLSIRKLRTERLRLPTVPEWSVAAPAAAEGARP